MRGSERPPARGARITNSGGHRKDNTPRPEVLDGRARFLADATSRAFAAGVRFALGRLANLAEADAETLALYGALMARIGQAA